LLQNVAAEYLGLVAVIIIMVQSTVASNDFHLENSNAGELEPEIWRLILLTDEQHSAIVSVQATEKLTQDSPADEQDILFTSEVQADGITTTRPRLTAKRSQHIVHSWRRAEGDKTTMSEYLRRSDEEEGYQPLGSVDIVWTNPGDSSNFQNLRFKSNL
jgi:hypothetical protein